MAAFHRDAGQRARRLEIRRLAIACLRQLVDVAPAVFEDFEIATLADGTEVATRPLATEAWAQAKGAAPETVWHRR